MTVQCGSFVEDLDKHASQMRQDWQSSWLNYSDYIIDTERTYSSKKPDNKETVANKPNEPSKPEAKRKGLDQNERQMRHLKLDGFD